MTASSDLQNRIAAFEAEEAPNAAALSEARTAAGREYLAGKPGPNSKRFEALALQAEIRAAALTALQADLHDALGREAAERAEQDRLATAEWAERYSVALDALATAVERLPGFFSAVRELEANTPPKIQRQSWPQMRAYIIRQRFGEFVNYGAGVDQDGALFGMARELRGIVKKSP